METKFTLETSKGIGTMSNKIQTQKAPAPVNITDEIQNCLNRLNREVETHVESGIRIGKELLVLKEIVPQGQYIELAEKYSGLKKTQCQQYMNVARVYGEKPTRVGFSSKVLIELSRPSTPESAREAAEQEKELTVKQTKELIAAHKRIKELESGKTPDINNLIPQLLKKYKGGSIVIGMATRLSVLDEDQQTIFLNLFESTQYADKEKKAAMDDKLRALEDLNKISKERDEVKKQLEEIATTDTAQILLDKEQALKEARKEYDRRLIKEREEIGKDAAKTFEKLNKDRIEEAERARDKALRERKDAVEGRTAANIEKEKLEREIEELKAQLEVDNPTNVDNARVRHIEDAGRGLLVSINELRKDMDRLGGRMELSIETVQEVIKKASLEVAKLVGTQDAIINI